MFACYAAPVLAPRSCCVQPGRPRRAVRHTGTSRVGAEAGQHLARSPYAHYPHETCVQPPLPLRLLLHAAAAPCHATTQWQALMRTHARMRAHVHTRTCARSLPRARRASTWVNDKSSTWSPLGYGPANLVYVLLLAAVTGLGEQYSTAASMQAASSRTALVAFQGGGGGVGQGEGGGCSEAACRFLVAAPQSGFLVSPVGRLHACTRTAAHTWQGACVGTVGTHSDRPGHGRAAAGA